MALMWQVKEALYVEFENQARILGLAFGVKGRAFDPPADGRYLIAKVLPNAPAWVGLSSGRMDQGLLQVDVHWPSDLGETEASAVADALMAAFSPGYPLGYNETIVTIEAGASQAEPLDETSDLVIPVTIPWKAV